LEAQKTINFNQVKLNTNQKIANSYTEIEPQRFPSLYNKQWEQNNKAEVIEDVISTELTPNGLPKLETNKDIKYKIRNAVRDLYSNLILTKTQDVLTHNLSVYKAVVEPLTSSPDVKYIVAIVPNIYNSQVGSKAHLSELDWVSFQTRSTMNPDKEFNGLALEPQRYQIPGENILHDRIKCVNETDTKWIYKCNNLPIQVDILVQKENENFASEGTVIGALELFQTILSF